MSKLTVKVDFKSLEDLQEFIGQWQDRANISAVRDNVNNVVNGTMNGGIQCGNIEGGVDLR